MKILDTDTVKLTRGLAAHLAEQCQSDDDGRLIFRTDRRHLEVEIYGLDRMAIVSVRRIAYALAHPEDHVAITEDVVATCGKVGDLSHGSGACVRSDHLVKRPRPTARRSPHEHPDHRAA